MMLIICCHQRLLIRAVFVMGFGLLAFTIYTSTNYFILETNARQAFVAGLPNDLASKPVTDEHTCGCSTNRTSREWTITGHGPLDILEVGEPYFSSFSSCDNYSSLRGPHQQVVSYAFYGISASGFMNGIEENAKRVAELYAGWTMRVYHSTDTANAAELQMLCKLWCRYPHLDFCQVGRLPSPLGDVSQLNGMIWRFLVLGDSFVDRFIVRDLDSIPYQREVDAVQDWIRSNVTWHFMHDHPAHNTAVMGGMWGGMNRDLQKTTAIRHHLIIEGGKHYYKNYDQELLREYIWASVRHGHDFISHASFMCTTFLGSVPFPSRRQHGEFVGSPVLIHGNLVVTKECPKECRPKDHLDWINC